MSTLHQDLEQQLGDWADRPLRCSSHTGEAAVAVCDRCRRLLCGDCLAPLPDRVRCVRCRPATDRWLPRSWVPAVTFLRASLGRLWAVGTLLAVLFFALVVILMPGVVRPRPPEMPDWVAQVTFSAPDLEQAYRLTEVGDLFARKGRTDKAGAYYRSAQAACLRFLDQPTEPDMERQVVLGIGQLQQKQGHFEEALAAYRTVLDDPEAPSGLQGIAHYYTGTAHEEAGAAPDVALKHFEDALPLSGTDFHGVLDKLVGFYAQDRREGKDLYTVASLTHTVTSAASLRGLILEAQERCQARIDLPADPVQPVSSSSPLPREAARDEILEFIPGE